MDGPARPAHQRQPAVEQDEVPLRQPGEEVHLREGDAPGPADTRGPEAVLAQLREGRCHGGDCCTPLLWPSKNRRKMWGGRRAGRVITPGEGPVPCGVRTGEETRVERPSPAVQDYLKAIYHLGESADHEGPITTTQVAEALGVTTASASNMLKKLDGLGYVDPGQAAGRGADRAGPPGGARGHPPPPPAGDLSGHAAGHVVGRGPPRGRGAGAPRLRGPRRPHRGGARAIPSATRTATPSPPAPGSSRPCPRGACRSCPTASEAVVGRVDDQDDALLRFLAERGLVPDATLEVLEHAPFGGPISVRVGGPRGRGAAGRRPGRARPNRRRYHGVGGVCETADRPPGPHRSAPDRGEPSCPASHSSP